MSQFNKVINRKNTISIKWNDIEGRFGNGDCIPMWVADTDFSPPIEVVNAFKKEIEHGVFGYSYYPESLYETIKSWLSRRHNMDVKKEEIFLNSAVLPSISLAIRVLTEEGDGVLMHAPVYSPFFRITEATKRQVVFSDLKYENNRYLLDLENFENQIVKEKIKLFILSNPHNPGSRAWTANELKDMADICKKHNVIIISDEIHSDLTMPHIKHIPMSIVAKDYEENIITLMAPTKTFNIAGVKSSYYIIKNKEYQKLFNEAQKYISAPDLNVFAIVGTEAAYKYGDEWVDELRKYIYDNYKYVKEKLNEYCPNVIVSEMEATYLMWISTEKILHSEEVIFKALCEAGVGLQRGSEFGLAGEKFFRINIGCPKETLEIAVERLIKGLSSLK